MSLLSPERSLEEGLQAMTIVTEKKGQTVKADVAGVVLDTYVLTTSIDNTSTIKTEY